LVFSFKNLEIGYADEDEEEAGGSPVQDMSATAPSATGNEELTQSQSGEV